MTEEQVASESVRVELIDFNDLKQQQGWPFDVANYRKGTRARGLAVFGCECGAHCFASAWDPAMERWVSHQTMHPRLKQHIEQKGMAPERPAPSPHVVLIDHGDEHLLTQRRWRALRSPRGYRAKFLLKSGTRSHAVQRLIYPGAEVIEFLNCNGLDLRRHNLRRTTVKLLMQEKRAREKAAKVKKGARKEIVKKAA